jgi:hypothetical protein
MLCLRASWVLYVVVSRAATRYGCVIDTLFHTLSRVDVKLSDEGRIVAGWDTESHAMYSLPPTEFHTQRPTGWLGLKLTSTLYGTAGERLATFSAWLHKFARQGPPSSGPVQPSG